MKVRRTLALLGPLTAAGALLLPWYYDERWNGSGYDTFPIRGWDLLTGMNWLVLGIVLAMAHPLVRASSSVARAAAVAGGSALAALALRCLFVPWEHTGSYVTGRGVGAWVVLAAGLATIAAGRALHARAGDVDTVRRLVALLGPLTAVSALCLPWFAYFDFTSPFPLPAGSDLGPFVERGWDEFTAFDMLLLAFGGVAAASAVAARRDVARLVCVLCGISLAVLAVISLATRAEPNWAGTLVLAGPLTTLAAGVITALAGFHLYAPRRIASSLTTAS